MERYRRYYEPQLEVEEGVGVPEERGEALVEGEGEAVRPHQDEETIMTTMMTTTTTAMVEDRLVEAEL